MSIREARHGDLELFCKLIETRTYPDNPVAGISGLQRQQSLLAKLRGDWERGLADPKMTFYIRDEPAAFLVTLSGDRDSLTGQPQTVLWEWAGEVAPLVEAAAAAARQRREEYLVVRVHPGEANPFEALEFLPELTRVLKRVEVLPEESQFKVRLATPQDLFFITSLNSQGMQFYLPANRGLNSEEIAKKNVNQYMGLDLSPESATIGLVIMEGRRPFGYILLKLGLQMELTGESAAYLYDLNLKPQYWGKGAGRIIGNFTQNELHRRGCQFLVGDISCGNPRALQVAIQAIGFKAEWERWGKAL